MAARSQLPQAEFHGRPAASVRTRMQCHEERVGKNLLALITQMAKLHTCSSFSGPAGCAKTGQPHV